MSSEIAGIEQELMSEPHISGHRVSVRRVHAIVEERGSDPQAVADGLGVDVADVYRALTYYHDHPGEMHQVAQRREERIEQSCDSGAITGPGDL